ncbi:hypothetical protein Ancab_029734 [Ancistrocladus abbreviatus]
MKDFCSMAVPSNHNNHEQDTGPQNASSSGEGVDVHKKLMQDLQDEEVCCHHIGWCKTVMLAAVQKKKRVMLALEISLLLIISTCVAVSFLSSYRRPLRLKSYYLGLETWNWSVLIMEIFCGLSVIRSITYVVLLLIKKHQTLRPGRYVLFFATGLKTTFDVTVWFSSVFFTWFFWLRPRMKLTSDDAREAVHYITFTLLCLSLGSISWLLKDMLCLRLEADLHFSQFFDRIRSTVLDLHGIRIIRSLGTWKFLKNKNLIWMEVAQMEQKTVPIWILKQLVEMYTRDIENNPLDGIDPDATKDDQKLVTLAQELFKSIVGNRGYICREDLQNTYVENKEELDYLFKLFEKRKEQPDGEHPPTLQSQQKENPSQSRRQSQWRAYNASKGVPSQKYATGEQKEKQPDGEHPHQNDEDQRIERDQFLSWAVLAYKKCWGLQRTLYSSKEAFIKLNRLLSTFVILMMMAIWLLATNIFNTSKLALLFSPFLASTFIFGNSCKNVFEGLIFTFGMHPFDVGDRVIVDGMQMKVRMMNFLTTVFFKYDTQEEVIYPKSILASKSISNLDIVPDQGDSLDFAIDAETPLEDIVDIENKIKKHLKDEMYYTAKAQVVKKEFQLGKGKEIKMTVYFKYLVSYLDSETRAVRRSDILTFIMTLLKKNKENRSNQDPSKPDDIVEFNIPAATSLKKIEELEKKIMRLLEDVVDYAPYTKGLDGKKDSKVLIKELDEKQIKMALYLKNPSTRISEKEKEQHKTDIKKKIEEKFIPELQQQEERSSGTLNLKISQTA